MYKEIIFVDELVRWNIVLFILLVFALESTYNSHVLYVASLSFHQTYAYFNETYFILGRCTMMKMILPFQDRQYSSDFSTYKWVTSMIHLYGTKKKLRGANILQKRSVVPLHEGFRVTAVENRLFFIEKMQMKL